MKRIVAILAFVFGLPGLAAAQQGAISGVARDTTGAVLPGVTVEAASPALIEKTRSAVTDGSGQYRIIELRAGTYTVTFTLPGFGTVKREGIELTVGFTAQVNADMRVGSVEETISVSGAAPVVDVQNVRQQRVMTREVIDTLPTGKIWNSYAALQPGTVGGMNTGAPHDVGGSSGDRQQTYTIHGSRRADQRMQVNGLSAAGYEGNGAATPYSPPDGSVQEIQMELGAQALDTESGGVRLNVIYKDGGNMFRGDVVGAFTNNSLQGNNLTDELRAQRLTVADAVKVVYDFNPTLGGPIMKDKLWFFGAYRNWGNDVYVGGNYFNATPAPAFTYTPDLSRQAYWGYAQHDEMVRLTWQATPRNKFTGHAENLRRDGHYWNITSTQSPESGSVQPLNSPGVYQINWTSPLSSRLLLEAGAMQYRGDWQTLPTEDVPSLQTIPVTELSTGYTYRGRGSLVTAASAGGHGRQTTHQRNYRATLNYVTGAHAVKVGTTFFRGRAWNRAFGPDLRYGFRNGRPQSLSLVASPFTTITDMNANLGVYVSDQWTLSRWTLNGGLRFDYLKSSVAPQTAGPGQFVPTRNLDLPGIPNVPNWKDLSPRFGVAYDVFGNGKTAIKTSLARFLIAETNTIAQGVNPMNAPSQIVNRTWGDADNDFVPDCDLLNPDSNGECGPYNNRAFGTAAGAQRVAADVTSGFGVRTYNWEGAVSVQHEVLPGASVTAGYYRRWYGNLNGVLNEAVTPADFDQFCMAAPVDSRLPNSGQQICGLYDVKPAKFGQVRNITVQGSRFGKQTEVYDGVDLTINARFARGVLLQGGYNIGRTQLNNCDLVANVANPGNLVNNVATGQTSVTALPSQRFCNITPKFLGQTKLQGSYPLPWNMLVSATFQNLAGPEILALWQAPNAAIAPTLGRNLAAGVNGVSVVQLIEPGTQYGDRVNQVDVRLAKNLRFGRVRMQGTVDVFNALNASPILGYNTTFGPNWLVPTATLPARFVKFGARLDF